MTTDNTDVTDKARGKDYYIVAAGGYVGERNHVGWPDTAER
ncbi:MAG TPA: hypothetical protein VHU84_00135 [Lacipirellulaceae bacterium]|nr:hypothetical protein [Lacipirellulaceae bacterium]